MKDIYVKYIKYLQSKEKYQDLHICEQHHIFPKHTSYNNSSVVFCTPKEHTLAHYYRFLAFQEKGDLIAYTMRWNQKIGVKERSQLAVQANRANNKGFWNSNFQSKQGKKGGKKGGSRNTVSQYRSRQQVGKHYGRQTGIGNQSLSLKNSLSCSISWKYHNRSLQNHLFLWTQPTCTAIELCHCLQVWSPMQRTKLHVNGIRK